MILALPVSKHVLKGAENDQLAAVASNHQNAIALYLLVDVSNRLDNFPIFKVIAKKKKPNKNKK